MKTYFLYLGAILIVALLVYTQLPDKVHIQHSVRIVADQERVYEYISDTSSWPLWLLEAGNYFPHQSSDYQLRILEAEPYSFVKMALDTDSNDFPGSFFFLLSYAGGATTLTWAYDRRQSVLEKLRGIWEASPRPEQMMPVLAMLKTRIENMPAEKELIVMEQVEEIHYLALEADLEGEEVAMFNAKMVQMLGALLQAAHDLNVEVGGQPICVFQHYADDDMSFDAGIPISAGLSTPANSAYLCKTLPEGPVVKAMHTAADGPLSFTHQRIRAYLNEHELQATGLIWEEYLTDPSLAVDSTDHTANVYYAVVDKNSEGPLL